MEKACGKVWKFEDDIDTDIIMPGFSMRGSVPKEETKLYCMSAIRPQFAQEVNPGDIIVAGKNFGCGSSRPAVRNFKELQISCVLADSFSAIFFRSAIAFGFPVIEVPGISEVFSEGDKAEVDFVGGKIKNLTTGKDVYFKPYPDMIKQVFESGGVIGLLKKELSC